MNKYILTIDKLSIQLVSKSIDLFGLQDITSNYFIKGNAYVVNEQIQLKKMPKLEKYYLHCFAVWFGEKRIATLSTDCRQAGQAGSIKLTFENEVFYTSPGWYYYFRELEQHLPLRFKSISCLDIAADFQSDSLLPELCRIYRYSSFINENTEIEYAPLVGKLGCTLRHGKQYEFGTSVTKRGSNGKQVAVYNKTLDPVMDL